jgi:hypothetical protein
MLRMRTVGAYAAALALALALATPALAQPIGGAATGITVQQDGHNSHDGGHNGGEATGHAGGPEGAVGGSHDGGGGAVVAINIPIENNNNILASSPASELLANGGSVERHEASGGAILQTGDGTINKEETVTTTIP